MGDVTWVLKDAEEFSEGRGKGVQMRSRNI